MLLDRRHYLNGGGISLGQSLGQNESLLSAVSAVRYNDIIVVFIIQLKTFSIVTGVKPAHIICEPLLVRVFVTSPAGNARIVDRIVEAEITLSPPKLNKDTFCVFRVVKVLVYTAMAAAHVDILASGFKIQA